MTNLLQKLFKLAGQTFSQRENKDFLVNFNNLGELMKQVKPADVNFNAGDYFKHDDYVPLHHNTDFVPLGYSDLFLIGIFILYKGAHLPLHDHPDMYGLIKVMHGRVRIGSYSHVSGNKVVEANKTTSLLQYNATSNPTVEVSAEENKVLVVSPVTNFHEIHPLTGGVAFMDILAPPYDSNRFCHYYKVKKQSSSGNAVLQQIPHVYD